MAGYFNILSSRKRTENTPVYPWYKQRLFVRSLKDPQNKQKLSGALDGHRWRFLNSRLDDFRDGYPLNVEQESFASSQCKTSPVLFGKTVVTGSSVKVKSKLSKEQVCFSKENPLKHMHHAHVDAVEDRLTQHPLALYPHLENGMAPELFDEVLLVLDPDMYLKKRSALKCEKQEHKDFYNSEKTLPPITKDEGLISVKEISQGPNQMNPYELKDTKTSWDKEDQRVGVKGLRSPSQDEDIKKVTKHFCDWVISLGGDTNNLTDSTVLGLFVSGYEKKPSLIFPIEVIKPSNIPEELRSAMEHGRFLTTDTLLKDSDLHGFQTKSKKTKFGAWYLDPKLWKKRLSNEPLRDPSALEEDMLFYEQPSAMDDELKQLHGTLALRQFIASKGLRIPRFLRALISEEDKENKGRGTDTTGSMSMQRGTVISI
ncbi:protein FAM47A isoform X2 [Alosa sapidissima]|uniref:protein FAM47A isoform X2 n=1 Tax=Alosa sapidissima TaxID=34773 RepID=UPI001C09CF3A|nr:protein FAM47A isoform X2 [Alosa sapidissima]